MHEIAQRPSERGSLDVDLFPLNGFDSYYKFTRENDDWQMLCREWHEILFRTFITFDRWISRQIRYEKLKWRNQPGKKHRTFRKSTFTRDHSIFLFCSQGTLNCYVSKVSVWWFVLKGTPYIYRTNFQTVENSCGVPCERSLSSGANTAPLMCRT